MANQRIDIDVGLKVDKTGLNQIKSSLQEIKNLTAQDLMKIGGHNDISKAEKELEKLKASISQIDGALDKAFNTDLGTLNVSKFNQALKGMNLGQVYKDFSAAGSAGQAAFRNVTSQILTTNMQLKQTHNFLNEMATTMANTVKWGVASSIMNNFTGSVQKAYGYVKSLDTSLNDIRIVTGASADEMERFAVKANNAAKELGKSTTDYTKASLIYYQQGLSDEDVAARAETTLKAANVTGQSGEAVSEQLTAVWNGYKVSAEEAELYIDKLAAVAATTASDLEELSTGMSKVASAANLMGVDIDSLNAQMATIVSVTRQAPESVGTALKTIYARMGDIEAGLDAETTLGNYTEEMKAMGVNVLDANGKLRDMGDVINEIGGNWKNLTREQQLSLSQTMAGTRQYNNLLSLFDNWDMYTKALNTSANAAGTLQKQQDTYMESTQAHLNQLKAASEDLYDSLLDPKGLNPLIDGLTTITNLFANFVDSIGGGGGALLGLGAIGFRVFSTQIATGLTTTVKNLQGVKYNAEQVSAAFQVLNQFKGLDIKDETTQKIIKFKEEILQLGSLVTSEQHNEANALIKSTVELKNQAEAWEKNKVNAEAYLQKSNISDQSISGLKKDDTSTKNIETLLKAQEDRYQNAEKNSQRYRQSLEELDVAIIELGRAEEKYTAGSTELANAENKTAEALQKVKGNMGTVQDSAKTMLGLLDSQSQEYKELTTAINEYNNVKNSGEEIAIQEAATKVVNAYSNAAKRIQSDTKNTREIIRQEANGASQDFQNSVVNAENTMSHFSKSLQITGQIDNIVKGISSLGSAAMALNSLSNIKNIISNETLSNSEKMLQIMMSLSMAAPILGTNIGNLVKNFGAAKDIMVAKTAVTKAETQMLMLEQSQIIANAAAEGAAQKVKEAGNNKKKRRIALRELNIAKTNQQTIATELEAASQVKEAATQKLANAEEKKSIGIKLALLAIQHPLATALGVGLVAAIGASVIAFKKQQKAAKESFESLKEGISDLESSTSELDGLKTSLQDVQNQLDELYSKGTLSITDQEDIANLEQQRVELETQLELIKDINAEKQQQVANDAEAAIDKGGFDVNGQKSIDAIWKPMGKNDAVATASIDVTSEETKNKFIEDQVTQYGEEWRSIIEAAAQEAYDQYHGNIISQYSEKLEALKTSLKAAEESGDDDAVSKIENKIAEIYDKTDMLGDTVSSAIDSAFGGDEAETLEVHSKLQDIKRPKDGWTEESLKDAGFATSEIEKLQNAADAADISLDKLVQTYRELGNEEIIGSFENNINKIKSGVEGEDQSFNKTETESVVKDLQKEYGVDDDFINRSLEKVDFSKIDYANFAESLKAAMEQAMAEQSQEDIESEKANFKQKTKDIAEENDFDTEAFEDMVEFIGEGSDAIKGLSDDLKENGEEVQEVAKDLTKYDRALEKVIDKSEDWEKALDSDNVQDQAEAIGEMRDAYGDLLDLDGDSLSQGFLKNAKNLDLLKQAANGSEEAYNQLREAAMDDIMTRVGIDKSGWNEEFNNLMNEYYQGQNLDDLEVGASLNDEGFLQGLTNMVNAAGLSASDATDLLSSMGIDAEVETATVDETEQETVTDLIPKITTAKGTGLNPADGTPTDVEFSGVTYDTVTKPITSKKQAKAFGLKVTSANKSSGGGFKYKNSAHGGGSKGGGSKKKSGGGGGGSSSKKTTKDKQEKTADRYHDINNEIDKLATKFDRLADAQDRLFGRDLYDNLNKQLKVLNQQIKAAKKKLDIAKEEKKELQDKLEDKGFRFDADGDITNYEKRLEALRKTINEKVTKYNNMSAKNQNKKAGKNLAEQIETLKEEYSEIEGWIDDYDELLTSTIPELDDEVTQLAKTKVEIQVEKFKLEAELRLDVSEAIRDWNDFKQEIFSDNKDIAKSIASTFSETLDSGALQQARADLNSINQAIKDIQGGKLTSFSKKFLLKDDQGNPIYDAQGNYQFDMNAALEAQEEYIDNIKNEISSFYDAIDNMHDNFLDSIDNAVEATEKYQDALETVNDVLEHTMNMITMINGEDSFEEIGTILNKQLEATKNIITSAQDAIDDITGPRKGKDGEELPSRLSQAKSELETINSQVTQAENKVKNAADDASRAQAEMELETIRRVAEAKKAEIEAYEEAVLANQETLRENLEQYVDLLNQQYQNTIAQANKTFENFMTGGLGREGMDREWQNAMAEEDKYLDAVNAAYELKSLENKINDSINSTDSLSAQKKLNEFKDKELKMLREKDKLTKYDIERANKLYEIELKKIALEEAQNNKSQMRLRRDSSGNYSYQFVADDESVSKAQQELDQAQNELYNMDKDEYRNRLEEVSQVEQDFEDFRVWYSEQSAEFRAANEKWYTQQCESYQRQLTDSAAIAAEARNNTIDSANRAMGDSFNEVMMESMLPTWKTGMAQMVDTITAPGTGFQDAATAAMNSVTDASKALATAIQELNELLGLEDGGLADVTSSYYTTAEQEAKDYATAQQANIDKAWAEVDAVKALTKAFDDLAISKSKVIGKAYAEAEEGVETGNQAGLDDADSIDEKPETPETTEKTIQVATLTTKRKKEVAAAILYRSNHGGWGEGDQRADLLESVFGLDQAQEVADYVKTFKDKKKDKKTNALWKYYLNGKGAKDNRYMTLSEAQKLKKDKGVTIFSGIGVVASAFDTGGYTGNWSSNEGKMAILHKKELVLNAKDTENLLKTVDIVRKLTEDIMNGSGDTNREKKDLDARTEALVQSVAEISQNLLPMLQTDKWNTLQDELKQESLNSLTSELTILGTNLEEFKGTDFLIALDHLNNTKDNLQSLVQTNQSQLLSNLESAEKELTLLETLNQSMMNNVLTMIQTQTEKINNNEANQEHLLTRMLEETIKYKEKNNDIQQTVEIHADFPNATNTNEIQKALENLVNAATQHAYTTRR